MRTVVIIVGGLVFLGLFVLAGKWLGGSTQAMVTAAKLFIPAWLVAALINMWIGVARAGYSVVEELPILLVIFVVPAAAAVLIWWKYS